MKRFLTSAAAAGLLVAGTGSGAAAQTPLFDIGVYGGLQWTSNWFAAGSSEGEGYSIGPGPIMGAAATFWTSPSFGVRLHGSYFPSGGPEADDDSVGEDTADNYALNNWFADLDLLFRPGAGPLYLFLGGGAMVTNVAGDPQEDVINCVPYIGALGACLSYEPSYASVGQGVVGAGFDFFPLGPFGIFGELAVHGYDSPVHETNPDAQNDKFAFTPRAVLGLKLGFGDLEPEEVVVIPPPPPVAPPPAPAPVPPPPPARNAIRVCVVQGSALTDVEAFYRPTMGDTLVVVAGQDRPFSTVYPSTTGYATGQTWFINNDPVTFNGREYVKFGVARVITPAELTSAGTVNGVGVWRSSAAGATDDIIYVPTRVGCEFQGYQVRTTLTPRG